MWNITLLKIQSALIKKAEDTEIDTAEQSAIKLRAQQQAQTSNALVVTDQPTANGIPPANQLGLVKMPRHGIIISVLTTVTHSYLHPCPCLVTITKPHTGARCSPCCAAIVGMLTAIYVCPLTHRLDFM